MAGRPTDWHWVDRAKDPTPGDAHTLTAWENYFRKRADDAQDAMYRLRDIQNNSTSLDLEGTWITAIWGRCDYLADQLLPEQTCHQACADAFKTFRQTLPDIQADADYGLKTAREAAADRQTASAALPTIDAHNAAADQAVGECAPADPTTLHKTRTAQDALNDAEGRIRKAKGLVDEAAANFHAAATALITALNDSVQTLGTGVFDPPPPNLDQTPPPHPSMVHQAVINELNGLYITASVATGVMQRTDDIGENIDEMMMFGGPENGGPGNDFALAGDSMSASLADSYAFGDDPFSGYDPPSAPGTSAKPLDDGWLMRGESWDVDPSVQRGPAKNKPKIFAPNYRHFFAGVRTAKKVASENTVILPGMNEKIRIDLAEIAQGNATPLKDGSGYEVNGRTYGVEPSGTVFPISGDGFYSMDRNQYKALQQIILADGDMGQAMKASARYPPLANNQPAFEYAMQVYRAAKEAQP